MSALAGQVAVVTGGAQGLGLEYARRLRHAGARVAIVDVAGEAARAAAEMIGDEAGADGVLAVPCDVSDERAVAAMVAQVTDWSAGPSVLINNAGGAMLPSRPMADFGRADWDHVIGVNLTGAWLCTQAVVPSMRARRYGKVINVSSTMVSKGWPVGLAPYIAAKAGIVGLTRALAKELGPDGIRVNAIAPGYVPVSTKKVVHRPEAARELRDRVAGEQCLPRTQVPADLCGAIEFLSSAESDFITGQVLNVDGGWVFG